MPNQFDAQDTDVQSFEISSSKALDIFDNVSTADPKDVKATDKKDKTDKAEDKPAPNNLPGFEDDTDETDETETGTEKDKKTEAQTDEKVDETDTGSEEANVFSTLSKELFQMGIFTKDEDEDEVEIDSPEDFASRWDYEAGKKASDKLQSYLSGQGEEKLKWFDDIYNKGISPRAYMESLVKIEDFSKLDLTKEDNQEKVVREGLKQQGFEPEDIDAEVTKLKNIGELEATSGRYHKVLVKREGQRIENLRLEAEQKKANEQRSREQYRVAITQLLNQKIKDKDFDGFPVNQQIATETFDSLYNYKYTLASGEPLTQFDKDIIDLKANPEMKLKVGLFLNMLKKDPTLSALKKKAVSKESNTLFNELNRKKKTATATNGEVTSWFQ